MNYCIVIGKLLCMETMIIQLTNDRASALLHELEELDLIKIISSDRSDRQTPLSEKYRGKISPGQAADLHKHIKEMRDEWSSGI